MKTIIVGGASSHCGKTELSCLLLKALPGWAAIKITMCEKDEVCPRGHDCGSCRTPSEGYEIVTDLDKLSMQGKDTARFLASGASSVVWVRSLPERLPESLELALAKVGVAPGVIVESTTAIPLVTGCRVLVTRPKEPMGKDSARRCLDLVDLVAVNVWPAEAEQPMDHSDHGLGVPVIPVCAALGPDCDFNRELVSECRRRVSILKDVE